MKLVIEINTDNAAFEEPFFEAELGAALGAILTGIQSHLALRGADEPLSDRIHDTNGNTVGFWEWR